MEAGVINHAIACSVPYPSNKFVAPAIYSDGWPKKETWMPAWMWTPGIPEGQKFRIKSGFVIPSSACQFVKVVMKAMQEYGIYVVDRSADRIGLYCENRTHIGDPGWEKKFYAPKKEAWDIYGEWASAFDNMEALA